MPGGVTVLAVGRLKEDYLRAACSEYLKRLGAYCKVSVVEVEEEPTAKGRGDDAVKLAEGGRILAKIPGRGFVVALDRAGRRADSEGFAQMLTRGLSDGAGHVTFIIGGSFGLSPEVLSRADMSLSFSEMTFPHRLMRVILLEQVYRAMNSLGGGKYHK
ncbi:MAG: 23S rRNA (pseudouridine(1915)-N(3))-methyltransferase RlmH [Defluviitaleaceae bacterium]|nr:23S rRNA (pseudouridine(1915)-N(3))-methyltransferase RlmH [Defluviitaleaceae bacterium]